MSETEFVNPITGKRQEEKSTFRQGPVVRAPLSVLKAELQDAKWDCRKHGHDWDMADVVAVLERHLA